MKFNLLLKLTFMLLITVSANSQWQPVVRLTNNTSESFMSNNNAWCIASSGDSVHVIWVDTRYIGIAGIYYKRSTDKGVSWGADARLTDTSIFTSEFPSVAVSGPVVHVVWYDSRDGNFEIYYKRSTDAGSSWGADTRLTNNTSFSQYPSLTVSGQTVHVVWDDFRDGNFEIYYKRSTDGGVNWGADTRLTNNSASSEFPSVSVSGLVVHVVWEDRRDANLEIYYKRSTDGGVSWGADTRLTNNPFISSFNSVAVSGSVVHVLWHDTRDGDNLGEIYYKRSTDGGVSWGADTRLTNALSFSVYPSVTVSGSAVHVVWQDNRDGNWEIYYKRSTDGGVSWGADTNVMNHPDIQISPFISVSGSVVHVVWNENRDGNGEIYYKRNPTGNPNGIININSEVPNGFFLSQNYPNPFNPNSKIRFQISKLSDATLVVFDVLGREVQTLVNEQLQHGTYEVDWDGSGFASGVYFYKLVTDGFIETKKMILIKGSCIAKILFKDNRVKNIKQVLVTIIKPEL